MGKVYQMNRENISADEMEHAAYSIFKSVARPGFDYIVEDDLLRLQTKEDVDRMFSLFDGAAETGKITRKAFIEWVVDVKMSHRDLAHSLNDIERVLKQLYILLTAILMVTAVVIWLYLEDFVEDFVTTGVSLTICAGLIALAVMFGIKFKNFKKRMNSYQIASIEFDRKFPIKAKNLKFGR